MSTAHKIVYDSTTAISAGQTASVVTGSGHEVLIILCTILAPLVRDIVIRIIDKYFSKKIG